MKKGFLILMALLFVLGGCGRSDSNPEAVQTDAMSAATERRYREGEVREYDGARLDPAVSLNNNAIDGVQEVDISDYRLEVTGLVENPLQLQYDEVRDMTPYERKITLYCVTGWDATILWKGVRLVDVIDPAEPKPEAVTVIFHAVDGYTTSLPLQTVRDKDLILAYGANGLDLPPEMGYPFIVVAEDKLGYKWARWVNGIELSGDPDYKGYWEERGYSNEADLET
jgi:DMSO/TMAO reductase YedYZ molybdopterin-dependent catalytic subunit